jgi:hypothetical protein
MMAIQLRMLLHLTFGKVNPHPATAGPFSDLYAIKDFGI